MKKTAIIILNYNNCRDTCICIASILQHNTAPVRIIVVDNASRPDEKEALKLMLAEICPQATLIECESNLGYARGNNAGILVAFDDPEIDKILILNNDIIFVEDIIPTLIRRMEQLPGCGIISPLLYKPGLQEIDTNCARKSESVDQMIQKNFLHYFWRMRGLTPRTAQKDRYVLADGIPEAEAIEVDLPSGSCMLIDKKVLEEIGAFDPATFLYYEENILYKKMEQKGLKCYICLDLKCIHLGAATTKQTPKSFAIIKANIDSQRHYVKTYSGASKSKQILYQISTNFFLASTWLQKMAFKLIK